LLADKILDMQQNTNSALKKANNAFAFASNEFSITGSVQKIIELYKHKN
jgi:cytidylate kinase